MRDVTDDGPLAVRADKLDRLDDLIDRLDTLEWRATPDEVRRLVAEIIRLRQIARATDANDGRRAVLIDVGLLSLVDALADPKGRDQIACRVYAPCDDEDELGKTAGLAAANACARLLIELDERMRSEDDNEPASPTKEV